MGGEAKSSVQKKRSLFFMIRLICFTLTLNLLGPLNNLCVWVPAHTLSHIPVCDPVTIAPQAPLSMGFPRQENRSGLPFPSPGDLPDPGVEPASLVSSALAGGYSLPLRCLEIPLNDWFLYFLRKYVFIPLFIIPAYLYYQIHAHLRDIFGSFSDHLNKASYTKCSVF